MPNLIVRASDATGLFDVGGGGGGYTPLYTWSAAGGTLSNVVTGWAGVQENRITYANDITGPFGGNRVGKQTLQNNDSYFGGTFIDSLGGLSIGNGDDLWIRVYHYFPSDFCFSSGTLEGDFWGATKWYRVEFTNGSRLTCQLGALSAGDSFASGPTCGTQVGWGGVSDEFGGSGWNIILDGTPPAQVTRGTWAAIQTHIRFSTTGTGYIESWIGSTYLGRAKRDDNGATSYITMPPGGSPVDFIMLGNYWNGAPAFNDDFFIDEVIITTETPDTLDSGGRPYISPSAQVVDF